MFRVLILNSSKNAYNNVLFRGGLIKYLLSLDKNVANIDKKSSNCIIKQRFIFVYKRPSLSNFCFYRNATRT